jgi:hypothetical protein
MEEHFHPKITTRDELEKMINQITCVKSESIRKAPQRIIAIGDLHGDFAQLFSLLNTLKIIDEDNNWIGGNTFIVQTGDVTDDGGRGHDQDKGLESADEVAIYHLLVSLNAQAQREGGGVLMCIGNHEIVNILDGNVNYVNRYTRKYYSDVLKIDRSKIFKVGSPMAKNLSCVLKVVIKLGDIYFCHGGISPDVKTRILDTGKWKDMDSCFNHLNNVLSKIINGVGDKYLFEMDLIREITWNRDFSLVKDNGLTCHKFDVALGNTARMVVGHTVQQDGINSICGNRIFRIDTAISRAFNAPNRLEALEILGGRNFYRIQIIDDKLYRSKL